MMIRRLLSAFALASLMTLATAQTGMTPERYVLLDLQVRELTLNGMARRLELLQSDASQLARRSADATTRAEVEDVYTDYGVTPGQHAAFGAQHAEAIRQWLHANPDMRTYYDDLERRLGRLSNRLSAHQGG